MKKNAKAAEAHGMGELREPALKSIVGGEAGPGSSGGGFASDPPR